jgi:hypothetical protein
MKVVAVDFNRAYLHEKQQALAGRTDVHFLHADVGDRGQLRAAADEAIRKFGRACSREAPARASSRPARRMRLRARRQQR